MNLTLDALTAMVDKLPKVDNTPIHCDLLDLKRAIANLGLAAPNKPYPFENPVGETMFGRAIHNIPKGVFWCAICKKVVLPAEDGQETLKKIVQDDYAESIQVMYKGSGRILK